MITNATYQIEINIEGNGQLAGYRDPADELMTALRAAIHKIVPADCDVRCRARFNPPPEASAKQSVTDQPGESVTARAVRDSAIAVGDVVRSKAGGPPMTVECYADDGRVSCVWFDLLIATFRHQVFSAASLQRVDTEAST